MRKIIFVLAASLFVFGKCNKDDGNTTVTTDTYLPSTVGTNWTYRVVTPTATSTVTYTVTNRDTTFSGISSKFQVISGSNSSFQYYRKSSSDYFTVRAVASGVLELNFLKDDKNVNDTWSTSQLLSGLSGLPGGITSVTMNTTYTIKAKGTTRVVNGNTYNNVIQVRADLAAAVPLFGSLPFGGADFYFAKNIGIIESNVQIANATAGININEQQTLQSYVIK
jgi:hypothetical protein